MSPLLPPPGLWSERRYSTVSACELAPLFLSSYPKLQELERVGFLPFVLLNIILHHVLYLSEVVLSLFPALGLQQLMKWWWGWGKVSLLRKVSRLEGIYQNERSGLFLL